MNLVPPCLKWTSTLSLNIPWGIYLDKIVVQNRWRTWTYFDVFLELLIKYLLIFGFCPFF